MVLHVLDDEQQKLAVENIKLVQCIISRYFGYEMAQDEDWVSIGYIGLCNAAATYSKKKRTAFSTYASKCIYYAVSQKLQLMHNGKRDMNVPVYSLNGIIGDDDWQEELINFIPDERERTEETAINNVLCEQVVPLMPLNVEIFSGRKTAPELYHAMKKPKSSLYQMLNRELRAARKLLKVPEPV